MPLLVSPYGRIVFGQATPHATQISKFNRENSKGQPNDHSIATWRQTTALFTGPFRLFPFPLVSKIETISIYQESGRPGDDALGDFIGLKGVHSFIS